MDSHTQIMYLQFDILYQSNVILGNKMMKEYCNLIKVKVEIMIRLKKNYNISFSLVLYRYTFPKVLIFSWLQVCETVSF